MTATREAVLLAVACALLYSSAATGGVPFFTRGEPREGLVVREMLATGAWLVPARPEGELARKPPLYYWAAAVAAQALPGRSETALRLPSVVLGIGGVLATWATARVAFGPAAALPAGLLLATALEWMRAAASARVDMTLAAALAAVFAALALSLAAPRAVAAPFAAGAAAGLGALAKGPVAIVLPGLALGAFLLVRRDAAERRRLRPLLVLGIGAAVAALWYAAAAVHEGPAFVDIVVRENLLRFVDTEAAETGHAHGAGYLLAGGLVSLLPWTPLLPLALVPLLRRPRPAVASLAAAWIATGFVFFALASSKRSVYLLPLFPAIAVLAGSGIASPPEGGALATAARVGAMLYAPLFAILAVGVGAVALGLDPVSFLGLERWLRSRDLAGTVAFGTAARAAAGPLALLAVATLVAILPVVRAARAGAWRRLVLLVAALVLAWTTAFAVAVLPAMARERSPRAFLARVERLVPAGEPLYARFPIDPAVRFYAPRSLARWPARHASGGLLVLWEDDWRRLRDAEGRPLPVIAVSDTSLGSRGHLALVRVPPGPLAEVAAPTLPIADEPSIVGAPEPRDR